MSDRMSEEHLPRHRDLGHVEGHVAAVARDLRADFNEFLVQAGQRPRLCRLRASQAPRDQLPSCDTKGRGNVDGENFATFLLLNRAGNRAARAGDDRGRQRARTEMR
jgi:hypothetical protein